MKLASEANFCGSVALWPWEVDLGGCVWGGGQGVISGLFGLPTAAPPPLLPRPSTRQHLADTRVYCARVSL